MMKFILQKDSKGFGPSILYESVEIAEEYTGIPKEDILSCIDGKLTEVSGYNFSCCTRRFD